MRVTFVIGAFLTTLSIAVPAFAWTSTFSNYTWKPLAIGAGGFLVGMDIAPDGTKVVRADTYGAYLWNGTQWQQLVTTQSMPASDPRIDFADGVYEIRIAPSNTSRFYMMYGGNLYRSDNKGTTWAHTNFAPVGDGANDSYRNNGEKMAVDPINPDVVVAGSPDKGAFMTTDGGTTWKAITSVPPGVASQGGMSGIAFDPSGGSTNGRTNRIFIASWGNGVYVSNDAGATWTRTTGGPTQAGNAMVSSDGYYYLADNSNLWSYHNGTWTEPIVDNNQGVHAVAVDPTNVNRIIVAGGSSILQISMDHGATWTGWIWGGSPPNSRVATDIPWLAWTQESYMSNGNIIFDPTATNKLYNSEGIGVWYANVTLTPSWTTGTTWYSQSLGIEQLVANDIIVPPGGKPLVGSWDRPVFYSANPDAYPSTHGPNNVAAIVMGWSVDYAATNPSFVAGIFNWWGQEQSAFSTDGGQSWTQFPTKPVLVIDPNVAKIGGSIAVSSPTNMIWATSDNGPLYVTQDGGKTWFTPTLGSTPTNGQGESGWGWAYYMKRQIVAADRVTAGTFYAYNYLTGLWRSTDGGSTWTLVHSGEISSFSGYNAKLRSVPGEAGNLFFTGGQQSGTNPAPEPLMRSTDGGATWTAVPNVLEVYDVGFGAAAPGQTYPAIYIDGWVNNVWGFWRSDDNAATWVQIGDFPIYSMDFPAAVAGDPNIYGRVYVGYGGSGYAYGDMGGGTVTPPPPPPPSAPTVTLSASPTSITSGQSSTLTWSSLNASSCTGSNFTASATSGSVQVTPTQTTTYSITCTGSGGSASASATVTVSSVTSSPPPPPPTSPPPPPPPPPPTTNTFGIGARVKTTANLNVRNKANTKSGKILCVQPSGALGTITSGPATNQGYTWWKINFDTGCDGWSVQTYLTTSLAYEPTSQAASAATTIDQLQDLIAKLQAMIAQLQGH